MWSEVSSNLIALLVGLATGFFFERRATKSAQRDAAVAEERSRELQKIIKNLRAELLGRNTPSRQAQRQAAAASTDLTFEALDYARERQDASGRIKATTLRNGLIEIGYTIEDIDTAIKILVEHNSLLPDGSQWKVQA